MATIAGTTFKGQKGVKTLTKTTLSASDTFSYIEGRGQVLILENTTAGALTATIDGSGATTVAIESTGGTVDISAGLAITLAAGEVKAVNLDTIHAYLAGTIAVTGGTGLFAYLLN